MKVSARNVLKGKVKKVNHGAVNSEVIVQLPNGPEIVSIITRLLPRRSASKKAKRFTPSSRQAM